MVYSRKIRRRQSSVFRILLGATLLLAPSIDAQIPNGITLTPAFGSAGAGAFGKLAGMEEIPGKPGHFLVVELGGKITLLTPGPNGHTRSEFARIPVNTTDDDQKLSPIAFHPNFAGNRKYYLRRGDAALFPRGLKVEEYEASADATKDSGKPPRTLLTIPMPGEFADHNGGGIAFGWDGYLYLGIGDGGWEVGKTPDPHNNGQNRESLLGKILRIDVNRKDAGKEYAIPADNPFVNDPNPNVRREIFAWGLRNPFRMSVDRLNGDIYVGDVGLFNFEKIYILKNGANYGWKLQEHTLCYTPGTCNNITVAPAAGFHPFGPVKCFIGGVTHRGNPASPFYGVHLFGDYTMKRLLAFKKGSAPVQVTDLQSVPTEPLGFTLDAQNNVYMVGYYGTIYKLEHKDLQPFASAVRPHRKPARLAGPGLSRSGPADLFALDGSRVGALDDRGNFRGLGASSPRPSGLLISRPR